MNGKQERFISKWSEKDLRDWLPLPPPPRKNGRHRRVTDLHLQLSRQVARGRVGTTAHLSWHLVGLPLQCLKLQSAHLPGSLGHHPAQMKRMLLLDPREENILLVFCRFTKSNLSHRFSHILQFCSTPDLEWLGWRSKSCYCHHIKCQKWFPCLLAGSKPVHPPLKTKHLPETARGRCS